MEQTRFKIIEGRAETVDSAPEHDLILAAQRGDSSAFQKLYDVCKERVYNLIYYSLEDAQQAEDVLQTVFVKVYQALPFFRLESGFLTWIYRVALNECKNRRRSRKFFLSIKVLEHKAHPDPGPEALQASEQLSKIVRDAVRALKPKYRNVIVLKYIEEMSYEEIAETLGCSVGTVASRLYRALRMLEKPLQKEGIK